MPDPIATALIAGLSAVVGGLIAAIGKPWGQDWVARQAEKRAAQRAREAEYRVRLERVLQLLGIVSVEGWPTPEHEREGHELPAAAYAVNDQLLIDAVTRMSGFSRTSTEWAAARNAANRRVGELLSSQLLVPDPLVRAKLGTKLDE